ncbi:hypothetical protein [Hymenobacter terrenus]|uniref:hypothetical protein n=1 Tax=Hymenobacter terrenus TaxID=1629124 RepID=UPI0006194332|nr:hypothetical protein [Hymenobacter terrenus]
MVQAQDFLLDATDGDLRVDPVTGDLRVGYSDFQHIEHIVASFPGFYRQAPLLGVGIGSYQKSSGQGPEIQRRVAIQLQADNYVVETVQATSPQGQLQLSINAERLR